MDKQADSKKLKTLIIDDEPIALAKLAGYVNKTPILELAGQCSSSLEALELLRKKEIDLIFTDINMPDINGLNLIDTLSSDPMVVFITAHTEYAVESYRLDAVDYLLKPYGFADFIRSVRRAYTRYKLKSGIYAKDSEEFLQDNMDIVDDVEMSESAVSNSEENDTFFVKVDYRFVRVNSREIVYIKGYGEYLQIFLLGDEKPLLTLSSFASIKEKLPSFFMQIHRSYIVNIHHISQVERSRVTMDNSEVLPVGDSYKHDFHEFISNRTVGGAGKG